MNYYSLGEYSIQKSREDNKELESKYSIIKSQYDKLTKDYNSKRELYTNPKKYNKKIFELETNMLILGYKIDINNILIKIAEDNIRDRFRNSINHKSDGKRIVHYNNALSIINSIINNPYVNGNIERVLNDTKNINILREFINIIKRLRGSELNNDILEVLNISSSLIKEYDTLINNIRISLNNQMNSLKVSTNQNFIHRADELNLFLNGIKRVVIDNKTYSSAYKDAQNEINKLNEVSILKKKLDKAPNNLNISTSVINNNISTLELLDISRRIEIIISRLLARLPKEKKYGSFSINYKAIIESCNNILNMLSPIKENNLIKLNRSGYYNEIGKLNNYEEKQKLTKSLSKRYEKLLGNLSEEEKSRIESDIKRLISSSNLTKNERNNVKMKAKNIARLNKNSINVNELHKFRTFKNNPSKKNSNNLNSKDIFNINTYTKEEKKDNIIEENYSSEMLSLSSELLYSNGMISSSDYTSLNQIDYKKVTNYIKTLKEYSLLPEEEVARRMALEPWVDKNGMINKKNEATPMDIISQMNINKMHNIMNRLSIFRENIEGKAI